MDDVASPRGYAISVAVLVLSVSTGCAKSPEGGGPAVVSESTPPAATAAASEARLPSERVVARVGDQAVTYGQLRKERETAFKALERKQQKDLYDLEQRELETWIIEQLVHKAAAAKGLTEQTYFSSIAKDTEISDEEVKTFYKEQVMATGRPFDEVKDRIKEYLVAQKSQESIREEIERLKKEAGVQIDVPAPAQIQETFDLAGKPVKGNEAAQVTIVEFSDFQCPFCSRANSSVEEIMKAYPDDVKVYFLHFPLAMHQEAMPAAVASQCAHEQGKFWPMHDVIFENQSALSAAKLEELAKSVGLDMTKYAACVKNPETTASVQADMKQGQGAGVQGTPTFFINGVQYSRGVPNVEAIKPLLSKS